jgi:hypothetical protein
MKIHNIISENKQLGPDKNDPWEQGWRAAHRRQDETACPYERGSKEHARWMDGYDEGAAQPNHYDEGVAEGSDDIRSARVGDEIILRNKNYSGVIVKVDGSDISFKNKSDDKRYKATLNMIDRNLSQERRYKEKSDVENKRFDDAIASDMERIHKSGALKKFGIGIDEGAEPYDYKVGQQADYVPLNGGYPPFRVQITGIDDEYIEFRSVNGQPIPGTRETEWSADPGWKVLTPVQGGGKLEEKGPGLWANIHAKQNRIKKGSGERMRKPGSKGAPTAANFKSAAKTESSNYGDLDEAFNLEEEINKLDEKSAAWQRKAGKSKSGGLNKKGVASYRRANPGSKLQTAVTTKPSKLKPGSKPAKRRKSFCARMSGVKGPMKDEKGKPTRKALALRKWNC